MRMRKPFRLLLLVAGSLVASTASAAITDGIVGYWSFDQYFTATLVGDGFTADDLEGFPEGADPIMGGPTIDSTPGNWQFGGGGGDAATSPRPSHTAGRLAVCTKQYIIVVY